MDEDGGAFSGVDPTAVAVLKGNVNLLFLSLGVKLIVKLLTFGRMLILTNWFTC